MWTPERIAIGHKPAYFKRAGVGTNGILECNFLSKSAHRTFRVVKPFQSKLQQRVAHIVHTVSIQMVS
jgi:hypothetical protein